MQEIHIKRFFECLIPVTVCNLKCSYCYVMQRNNRNMELAKMNYSPEHIGRCLTRERLGGGMLFLNLWSRGDISTAGNHGYST